MIRQNKTVSFIKTVLKNIAVIFDNTVLDFFRHNGVIYAGALAFYIEQPQTEQFLIF